MSDVEGTAHQLNNEPSQKVDVARNETPSMKKGRFLIENAKTETQQNTRKLRSNISNPESNLEYKLIVEIIEKQNEQIETIFDMLTNLAGNDKLFQKEFTVISANVSEKIEKLRNLFYGSDSI